MKDLMKFFTVLYSIVCINHGILSAQDYKNGIGVRLGGLSSGLSLKHYYPSSNALEGIIGFGYRSTIITGLYEVSRGIKSAPGLTYYWGGGLHLGMFGHRGTYFIFRDRGKRVYVVEDGGNPFVPGVDFVLGLEYKFNAAPLSIGLDMKPFIDLYNNSVWGYWDGALSFRFDF